MVRREAIAPNGLVGDGNYSGPPVRMSVAITLAAMDCRKMNRMTANANLRRSGHDLRLANGSSISMQTITALDLIW
jgi:hypothetical protein